MLNLVTSKPYMSIENNSVNFDEVPLDTEKQIRDVYGNWFCDIVGIEHLLKMPRVTSESLKINDRQTYHEDTVLIDHLNGKSAVKGLDGSGRPFIAFVVMVNDKDDKPLYRCVELLHKRYNYGKDDIYVSAQWNKCDDGISRQSNFFTDGWNKDFSGLKDFFDGKKIKTSLMEKLFDMQENSIKRLEMSDMQKININQLLSEMLEITNKRVQEKMFDMQENSIKQLPEKTEEHLQREFGELTTVDSIDIPKNIPYNDQVPLDKKKQLREVYGDWFCDTVGIDNLKKMPRVTAESLNLQNASKYHSNTVLVDAFKKAVKDKETSAVKGLDGYDRPFIAILMQGYDKTENKLVNYVELISKRHSIRDFGDKEQRQKNKYISALYNMCDDGKSRQSVFYNDNLFLSHLKDRNWDLLKKLLGGEPVRTYYMTDGFVSKV